MKKLQKTSAAILAATVTLMGMPSTGFASDERALNRTQERAEKDAEEQLRKEQERLEEKRKGMGRKEIPAGNKASPVDMPKELSAISAKASLGDFVMKDEKEGMKEIRSNLVEKDADTVWAYIPTQKKWVNLTAGDVPGIEGVAMDAGLMVDLAKEHKDMKLFSSQKIETGTVLMQLRVQDGEDMLGVIESPEFTELLTLQLSLGTARNFDKAVTPAAGQYCTLARVYRELPENGVGKRQHSYSVCTRAGVSTLQFTPEGIMDLSKKDAEAVHQKEVEFAQGVARHIRESYRPDLTKGVDPVQMMQAISKLPSHSDRDAKFGFESWMQKSDTEHFIPGVQIRAIEVEQEPKEEPKASNRLRASLPL